MTLSDGTRFFLLCFAAALTVLVALLAWLVATDPWVPCDHICSGTDVRAKVASECPCGDVAPASGF